MRGQFFTENLFLLIFGQRGQRIPESTKSQKSVEV